MNKSAEAFRTISEVAEELGVPKHVLRFWEVKFAQIRPMKRGGGRRFYRPEDMELLRGIRHLLHREGYTIKGVQKILREQGVEAVKQHGGQPAAQAAGERRSVAGGRGQRAQAAVGAAPLRPADLAPAALARPRAEQPGGAMMTKEARQSILAVIDELEACRSLLAGEAAGSATALPVDEGAARRR